MKIVVSADGVDLDAPASPVFGRCPVYVFVDTETMAFESVENLAVGAPGGAGIQAAQFVVERGAQAAVTGNMGPNAFSVLQSAGIPIYLFGGGTVRQAVEAFKAGQLQAAGGASAPAHAGMGMGRGMGSQAWGSAPQTPPQTAAMPSAPSREEEIAALKDMAGDLRKQLADVLDRLDRLEKGG
ncbi:MAG TPA: NifB/NifX family molybdenum-iron cluster-binding protein [Anaerolineae bacterium]|nr:NifB/NifX family molybdenum-iron cluster-binding protein [Anaerolineae bacterium]